MDHWSASFRWAGGRRILIWSVGGGLFLPHRSPRAVERRHDDAPGESSPCGPMPHRTPPFVAVLEEVFWSSDAHIVSFPNPYSEGEAANTVYVTKVGEA